MQWLLLSLWAGAGALKRADEIQTSAGFTVAEAPSIYHASLLQSQAETLAHREQVALQSQQQALEVLASQQGSAAVQHQELQAEVRRVEDKARRLEELVQKQSQELLRVEEDRNRAEALLQEESQAVLRARTWAAMGAVSKSGQALLQIAASSALQISRDIMMDQLLSGLVYFVLMMCMAFVYTKYFTYQYPKLKNELEVSREHFNFSLFECCNCDPEAPSREIMYDRRIPCFSCCCGPIRWADTASSSKTDFISFWPAVVLAVALNALAGVSFYGTALIFVIIATVHRQHIRKTYGLPYGNCSTCTEDLCTWTWCSCCATMQEAMEIQYINPPTKPWQQTMESLLPSALQSGRQERSACC